MDKIKKIFNEAEIVAVRLGECLQHNHFLFQDSDLKIESDCYLSENKIYYRGTEVFKANRVQYLGKPIYQPGEWEDLLKKLADKAEKSKKHVLLPRK